MAFQGFRSSSGPARPPSSKVLFGGVNRPPAPSPPPPLFDSSPLRSPPLFDATPPQPSPPSRGAGATYSPQSPPPGFESPSVIGVSYPLSRANISRPIADQGQSGSINGTKNVYTYQRPSTTNTSSTSGTATQGSIPELYELNRTSPPFPVANSRDSFGNNILSRKLSPPKSPLPKAFMNHQSNIQSAQSGAAQRPASNSNMGGSRSRSPVSYADLPYLQEPPSVSPAAAATAAYTLPRETLFKNSPRTSSPPIASSKQGLRNDVHNMQNPVQRLSTSTTVAPVMQTVPFKSQPHTHREVIPPSRNNDLENLDFRRPSIPKRTRSPPALLRDMDSQEVLQPTQNDSDRETQAKAKRMARFKIELREDEPKSLNNIQKLPGSRPSNSIVEKGIPIKDHPDESMRQYPNDNSMSDYEALESSNVIMGLCPDMCPESERAERERKGDLDQYERLDGDRNQTDKSLAVKKYTRTAEREAVLIRPMPILQKTIQYLLNLLNNPYDDRFLGMYNFLWDRMRAIRMDLRMQHIFNLEAITMLEQMIRLHIVAMHELCEYTKGEGFSEGFDAHLNIEQMNKTSVELFQMYDDHRKKGVDVPTEKEFRGYYALLKLDKHPGYKVEPAELSLELSKMNPELRQKPEILFARDVARACRTGNFIAFFRLARRATYLQACLMHAHFAKLRTKALASLHSGLLNGQGIPVSQVSQWLALEEDEADSLLDFHGFSLKDFDEPYMVKDGPFLNSEKDYPTKCSNLVHLKKSKRIVDDIMSSITVPVPNKERKIIEPHKIHKIRKEGFPVVQHVKQNNLPREVEVNMIDQEPPSAENDGLSDMPVEETPTVSYLNKSWVPSISIPTWSLPSALKSPPMKPIAKDTRMVEPVSRDSPKKSFLLSPSPPSPKPMPLQIADTKDIQETPAGDIHFGEAKSEVPGDLEDPEIPDFADNYQVMVANEVTEINYDKEVAEAKLKLIIRIWKRRTSKIKVLREKRVFAANAALNSLSLGLPIRSSINVPSTSLKFDINHVMRERYEKREKCWSPLNVSEVVADQLCKRNPEAGCLCFKLIICSQLNNHDISSAKHKVAGHRTASWLLSKFIPDRKVDDDLLVLFRDLAIWRTWVSSHSSSDAICCLSVIKHLRYEDPEKELTGANAILFLLYDGISLELQRASLHKLLMSLPSGSRLPLLILCGSYEEVPDPSASVFSKLDLCNVDKTRISEVHVMFLSGKRELESSDRFHSDDQLRHGLRWMASQSPVQPILHCAEIRDVVLCHLKSSLDRLMRMSAYEVNPEDCVAAFNTALDKSVLEVVEAAKGNPTGWPCPEIILLDNSCNEHRACDLYLPSIGWSSPQRTDELVCTLNSCKLPALTEDLTWLHEGSFMGEEIEKHTLQLENCLVGYLTKSAKVLGLALARQEARLILQKNTRLELHNSRFYLVPDWAAIYQRIFNWQMMNLIKGKHSAVYLPRHEDGVPQTSSIDSVMTDVILSLPYCLDRPSLDEMVEVGRAVPEVHLPSLLTDPVCSHVQVGTYSSNPAEYERDRAQDRERNAGDVELHLNHLLPGTSTEFEAAARKEAERLSELLNSCDMLQNSISKKLSLYF
uniref:PCI domain-containing protein n=3 Tax=Kalanchoe fedtschenkoi TaxID=63787 RepID=A0A7N0UEF8_KALFE